MAASCYLISVPMHCFHMLQVTWGDPIQIKLDVEITAFASGGMRKAYRGEILPACGGGIFRDREKVVLKQYRDDVAEPWSERYQGDMELTKSKLVEKVCLYLQTCSCHYF